MDDKVNSVGSLLENATEFGKTSYELFKLKALDKTSELASLFFSHLLVILFVFIFIVMINIGIALWLGEMLGKIYYGFFIVAAFYLICGGVLHFFFKQQIKNIVNDSIIKQMLK